MTSQQTSASSSFSFITCLSEYRITSSWEFDKPFQSCQRPCYNFNLLKSISPKSDSFVKSPVQIQTKHLKQTYSNTNLYDKAKKQVLNKHSDKAATGFNAKKNHSNQYINVSQDLIYKKTGKISQKDSLIISFGKNSVSKMEDNPLRGVYSTKSVKLSEHDCRKKTSTSNSWCLPRKISQQKVSTHLNQKEQQKIKRYIAFF